MTAFRPGQSPPPVSTPTRMPTPLRTGTDPTRLTARARWTRHHARVRVTAIGLDHIGKAGLPSARTGQNIRTFRRPPRTPRALAVTRAPPTTMDPREGLVWSR